MLAQTLTDFELIISDDGSTDLTVAIASEYERRDPSRPRSVNERNLGEFGNRASCARASRAASS